MEICGAGDLVALLSTALKSRKRWQPKAPPRDFINLVGLRYMGERGRYVGL